MKPVTRFEVARPSTTELLGLYQETFNAAAGALADKPDLRSKLASLESIRIELALRN